MWRVSQHLRRYVLVVLGAAALSACSFGFLYRHLDWIIPWELGEYVELDDAQASYLERRLGEHLAWHCSTQLRRYAEWLHKVDARNGNFDRAAVVVYAQQLNEFWLAIVREVLPDLTSLFMGASEQQIEELYANFEHNNREEEHRYVDATSQQITERRLERMRDVIEEWIGPLDGAQGQRLNRWANALGSDNRVWLANRRRWLAQLRAVLSQRAEDAEFPAHLGQLFLEPSQFQTADERTYFADHEAKTITLLTDLLDSLTTKQRRHFHASLNLWAEKFGQIACAPR